MDENPYKAPEETDGLPSVKRRLLPKLHWTEWVTIVVILGVIYALLLPGVNAGPHPRRQSGSAAQETKPVDSSAKNPGAQL
jgi:hypothetical protein